MYDIWVGFLHFFIDIFNPFFFFLLVIVDLFSHGSKASNLMLLWKSDSGFRQIF